MKQFATYEEENIRYWTNRASGYSGVNQEELASDQKTVWRGVISRRIAARFPGKKPSQIRVLDVGTGPGFFAIILAELGYQVTAVDYTASMLEEARRNAGSLANEIDFRQMNAEKLTFETASFDVLVTRNVTWNLPNPEKAYALWMRVLTPGGLLLNFDANWYRYLWDEVAQLGHAQDRENLQSSDVRDETAGTDVNAMEAIARQAPLSARHRPAWDLDVLRGLGGCRLPPIQRCGNRSGPGRSGSTMPLPPCSWWKRGSAYNPMPDNSVNRGEIRDLTQGPIGKQLFAFALPLFAGSLIQLLYNTVDLMFVGRILGADASPAVGASSLIVTCILGVFTGLSVGVGVAAAKAVGSGDTEKLKDIILTAAGMTCLLALVFTVLGLLMAPRCLRWMRTPEEILPSAVGYLRLYLLSLISIVSYNIGSGILPVPRGWRRF